MTERIRYIDNHVRRHSALDYRPPAPQAEAPKLMQNQPMVR
jgi:hypothetical protein